MKKNAPKGLTISRLLLILAPMNDIKYIDVVTQAGEPRIAAVIGDHWLTISAGIASLLERRTSADWQGNQCPGEWMAGETVSDDFGQVFKHQPQPQHKTYE